MQDLTWYFTHSLKVFFRIWQSVKLIDFSRKLLPRRHDVLVVDRTSINQTLTTIAPIFYLPQPVIVGVAANVHPFAQQLLLGGLRVDAIVVSKCQHSSIIGRLLELLNVVNKYKAVLEARGLKPNYSIKTKNLVESNFIEIVIQDNGTEIPQNILDKIFAPFFTTKPPDQGTGVGLYFAHDLIITRNRGQIIVDSQPGVYTTFTIILPKNVAYILWVIKKLYCDT